MTTLPPGNPLSYLGVRATNPPEQHFVDRAPLTSDYKGFEIGDEWIYLATEQIWKMVGKTASSGSWRELDDSGDVDTLTGDTGGAISSVAGDIILAGTSAQGISTAGSGNTITWTIADATETQKGVLEVSTDAETLLGTSDALAITPLKLNTKLGTQTANGIAYGLGTAAALGWTAELANGELLIGSVGNPAVPASLTQPAAGFTITGGAGSITFALADDLSAVEGLATTGVVSRTAANTWATSSITENSLLYGNATEGLTNLGVLTNGQLAIGSTGAAPVAATLIAGTGITIGNAAGVITISASGGGFSWTEVTGTSQAMAVDSGYVANNGALVTLTLPATAAQFTTINVIGKGAGGWAVAQNAGQTIYFGDQSTTAGVGGSLASSHQRDVIELICITTDTEFEVVDSTGNITVT